MGLGHKSMVKKEQNRSWTKSGLEWALLILLQSLILISQLVESAGVDMGVNVELKEFELSQMSKSIMLIDKIID